MSMHPYRGIVCIDRQLDGISMRPYNSNTLPRQSSIINNAPRYLIFGSITWNPVPTKSYGLRLSLHLHLWHKNPHWSCNIHDHATASISLPLTHQVSDAIPVIGIVIFLLFTSSNLIRFTVYDLIWLIVYYLVWPTVFDWIWLSFLVGLTRLTFNTFIFKLSHTIRVLL